MLSYLVNPEYPDTYNLQPTPDAPLADPCPASNGLLRLDSSGSIGFATSVPSDSTSLLVAGSGAVHLLPPVYPPGAVKWRLDPAAPAAPLLGCTFVPFAGSPLGADGRYGPGTVVVLQGKDDGPATPVDLPPDSTGRVAREAGGVRVLVYRFIKQYPD